MGQPATKEAFEFGKLIVEGGIAVIALGTTVWTWARNRFERDQAVKQVSGMRSELDAQKDALKEVQAEQRIIRHSVEAQRQALERHADDDARFHQKTDEHLSALREEFSGMRSDVSKMAGSMERLDTVIELLKDRDR